MSSSVLGTSTLLPNKKGVTFFISDSQLDQKHFLPTKVWFNLLTTPKMSLNPNPPSPQKWCGTDQGCGSGTP